MIKSYFIAIFVFLTLGVFSSSFADDPVSVGHLNGTHLECDITPDSSTYREVNLTNPYTGHHYCNDDEAIVGIQTTNNEIGKASNRYRDSINKLFCAKIDPVTTCHFVANT